MFHDLHEVTTPKPSIFLRKNHQPANRDFCCCGFFLGNIDNSRVLGIQKSIFETPLERELSFSGFTSPWPPGPRLGRSHGRVKILRFRCKSVVFALQGGSLLRGLISYANKHHVRSYFTCKRKSFKFHAKVWFWRHTCLRILHGNSLIDVVLVRQLLWLLFFAETKILFFIGNMWFLCFTMALAWFLFCLSTHTCIVYIHLHLHICCTLVAEGRQSR